MELPKVQTHNNLQNLNGRHHEILRLHTLGLKNTTIAEYLGISETTVSKALNSPIGKMELSRLYANMNEDARNAQRIILDNQALAAKVLEEGMKITPGGDLTTKDAWNIRLKSALSILNKGEHPDKRPAPTTEELADAVAKNLSVIKELARKRKIREAEEVSYTEI